jgi:hypothetical protein
LSKQARQKYRPGRTTAGHIWRESILMIAEQYTTSYMISICSVQT